MSEYHCLMTPLFFCLFFAVTLTTSQQQWFSKHSPQTVSTACLKAQILGLCPPMWVSLWGMQAGKIFYEPSSGWFQCSQNYSSDLQCDLISLFLSQIAECRFSLLPSLHTPYVHVADAMCLGDGLSPTEGGLGALQHFLYYCYSQPSKDSIPLCKQGHRGTEGQWQVAVTSIHSRGHCQSLCVPSVQSHAFPMHIKMTGNGYVHTVNHQTLSQPRAHHDCHLLWGAAMRCWQCTLPGLCPLSWAQKPRDLVRGCGLLTISNFSP
jgi:hypothetical protein